MGHCGKQVIGIDQHSPNCGLLHPQITCPGVSLAMIKAFHFVLQLSVFAANCLRNVFWTAASAQSLLGQQVEEEGAWYELLK